MYDRFLDRTLRSTTRSVLLLGPRQVGKSTLLAALQPDLTINLASPAAFRDYAGRPEQLERELDGAPETTKTVLLDEVQRVPELLDACELQRRIGAPWPEAALHHYRTRHGAEVDFVLEIGRELWGIEVKAARRVDRSMLRGLTSLAERSDRVARRLVVFLGPRRQQLDGAEALPLDQFLALLPD